MASGVHSQWLADLRYKDPASLPHLRTNMRDHPSCGAHHRISGVFSHNHFGGHYLTLSLPASSLQVYLPIVSSPTKSFACQTWSQNLSPRSLIYDTISLLLSKGCHHWNLCVYMSGFAFPKHIKVLANYKKNSQVKRTAGWIFEDSAIFLSKKDKKMSLDSVRTTYICNFLME